MTKGRKPQAISKRKPTPQAITDAMSTVLAAPMVVSMVPDAMECWSICTQSGNFAERDVMMLQELCMAYAANRQAWRNMYDEETGELVLTVNTLTGDLKKSPNWSIWNESANTIRQLSGVLGLDPLTAERLNLTKATTSSIAADIPAKVARAVRDMNGV